MRSTLSVLAGGAAALGFDFAEMLDVINALKPSDFYKSMTTHADHRVWQDVYRPVTRAGVGASLFICRKVMPKF